MNLVLMMRHSKLVQLCPSAFKQRRTDVDWDALGALDPVVPPFFGVKAAICAMIKICFF